MATARPPGAPGDPGDAVAGPPVTGPSATTTLAAAAAIAFAFLTLVESAKIFVFPASAEWPARAVTIILGTLLTTAAAYGVLRRLDRLRLPAAPDLGPNGAVAPPPEPPRPAAEEAFRQIAENIDEVLWMATSDHTRVLFVNPAYEKVWGRTRDELYRTPAIWLEAIHPGDRKRVAAALRDSAAAGAYKVEYRVVRPDGSVRWVWDNGFRVGGGDGLAHRFVGLAKDVTDWKRLEEQYRQSQKMEAFGQLAGGVAHDFNNLLTVINGYAELLLGTVPPGDPLRDMLSDVRQAGERASSLTRQLLAFSRKQVLQPKVLDLNGVVSEMGKMLRRVIGEDVELVTDLCPELRPVTADLGQIEQVLLNLAVNARDAMPQGGKLTVRTYNAGVSEAAAAAAPGARPGPCAVLAVADTGCGMTAEVKARIFEPFFTTKELGKGTGLGLATVYGVVEQSGGFIEFDSEPGHGTEFRIFLPRSKATDREIRTDEIRLGGAGGKETVLLVEDEDAVRALAALILRQAGYTVLQARDGREAVFLGEKHQGRIDLLLSDVVMPGGIGGGQVAQRLTGLRPGLKVLFMSGYTDDAMVRHGVLGSAAAFLQKPFTPPILTRKVREVLD